MARDAIHRQGQTEKKTAQLRYQYSTFVCVLKNKRRALGAAGIVYNVWRCRENSRQWSELSALSARDKLLCIAFSKLCKSSWCVHWFLPVCVGRSLLLPAVLHHGLVLAHPQPPSLHNAGPFGPGLILVVRVALQMLSAQPRLLFVIRLLLLIGHALPSGA